MSRIIIIALLLLSLFTCFVFATPPSGTSHKLIWSSFTNGGTEAPEGRSGAIYRLNDNLGDGTASHITRIEGTFYHIYGGFRKVQLDLRPPYSSVNDMDDTTGIAAFAVSWSGIDTTREDGEGWGIWVYDVQYRVGLTGEWVNWLTGYEDTFAIFGPTSPVIIQDNQTYFFRCRAHDLATNVEDWPSGYESMTYVNLNVSFTITSPGAPPDSVWDLDTIDVYTTQTMTSDEKFIVTNTGAYTIGIGLRADSTGAWMPNYFAAKDTFVVRGIFNDSPTPPAVFHPSNDYIAKYDRYATTSVFGTGGHNITPATTENFWLQFISPTYASTYEVEEHLKIIVFARGILP
ncbi:hypothetical protein JW877_08830 [bacterium]|nr:hypothetical protein [bacterium]